jgi:hypothetical protein
LKNAPTAPASEPSDTISPAALTTLVGLPASDKLSSLEHEVEELKQEFETLKNAPTAPASSDIRLKKHLVHLQQPLKVVTILQKNIKM